MPHIANARPQAGLKGLGRGNERVTIKIPATAFDGLAKWMVRGPWPEHFEDATDDHLHAWCVFLLADKVTARRWSAVPGIGLVIRLWTRLRPQLALDGSACLNIGLPLVDQGRDPWHSRLARDLAYGLFDMFDQPHGFVVWNWHGNAFGQARTWSSKGLVPLCRVGINSTLCQVMHRTLTSLT